MERAFVEACALTTFNRHLASEWMRKGLEGHGVIHGQMGISQVDDLVGMDMLD